MSGGQNSIINDVFIAGSKLLITGSFFPKTTFMGDTISESYLQTDNHFIGLISDLSIPNFQDRISSTYFSIYPNPVNEILYVHSNNKSGKNVNYQIYNCQGQLLSQGKLNSYINIAALQPGLYFINLRKWKIVQLLSICKS